MDIKRIHILISLLMVSTFVRAELFDEVASSLNIFSNGEGRCNYRLASLRLKQELSTDLLTDYNEEYRCLAYMKSLESDASYACLSDPHIVFGPPQKDEVVKIEGVNLYFNFIPGRYAYRVNNKNGLIEISLRIAFNSVLATEKNLRSLERRIKLAQYKWNKNSPFDWIRFKFDLVEKSNQPDFIVSLDEDFVSGPYFVKWSLLWGYSTIAHEIGHMLGLVDEYGHIRRWERFCDLESMMCRNGGDIQLHHYYTVLKRQHCKKSLSKRIREIIPI